MRFIIDRRAARLAIAVVCVVLVGGCGGQAADSTAAPEPTASTLPPTTTIPPLTAEEVAWLDAVDKLPEKMETAYKEIRRTSRAPPSSRRRASFARAAASCGGSVLPATGCSRSMCWRRRDAPSTRRGRDASSRPLVLASRWLIRPRVGRWTARFSVASTLRQRVGSASLTP